MSPEKSLLTTQISYLKSVLPAIPRTKVCFNNISELIKTNPLPHLMLKGWLAIAKLKPLSLFISLLLMLKKAFDNIELEK